jgi:hypothetical protein
MKSPFTRMLVKMVPSGSTSWMGYWQATKPGWQCKVSMCQRCRKLMPSAENCSTLSQLKLP